MADTAVATHPRAVAVVGAGNMGGAMVERLCEAGWAVAVHDTDPAACERAARAGARVADCPAKAVANLPPQGALVVVVVDAAQTRTVLQQAAPAMRPGQAVLLCPTIAPDDTEALAASMAPYGLQVLDAPMSGGPARARDGSMSLMVAAPREARAAQDTLLRTLSSKIFDISTRVGDGARTKLVNNLLAGINLVGAAEVLALAERLGLSAQATLDVIGQSSGQSWIGQDRMARAVAGDFEPRAHMTLLEKDTRLALEAARAVGFAGPLGAAAARTFAEASAAGLHHLDDAALLLWLRRQNPGAQAQHPGQ
jgi:L-threonate 2-dehydrogenase